MSNDREQHAQPADPLSDTARVRVSIARAKFEWETTVDALPDLICLLDSTLRVVRVNRVVERWNLGSITDVLGRDLHGLLHDHCGPDVCSLQTALSQRHCRRKNCKQHVAIVRLTERVLHLREPFGWSVQGRFYYFEAFQSIAKALAGDTKIMQAFIIAHVQAAGQAAYFTRARLHDAIDQLPQLVHVVKIDAFRLHAAIIEGIARRATVFARPAAQALRARATDRAASARFRLRPGQRCISAVAG